MKTLEEAMIRFRETCEACDSKLVVHAFRKKSSQKKQIIYCHCENKTCRKYNQEIAFI